MDGAGVELDRLMPLTSHEKLMTLGVHRATVYRWAETGLIPNCKRLGKRIYCRPSDVEKFLATPPIPAPKCD